MFRNFAAQTLARQRISGGILPSLQLGLALAALACGWMAIRHGLNMQVAASSLCLGAAKGSWLAYSGHCAWCYSALTLTALAAWPVNGWKRSNGGGARHRNRLCK